MKYLGASFSVAVGSDDYRANFDRIFKKHDRIGKTMLREIKQHGLDAVGFRPTGMVCPKCGKALFSGPVRCPDGIEGCLVLHRGMICGSCGSQFA